MFSQWTFGRKLGAGFSVAGLVIVLVAVAGYVSTQTLIENEVQLRRTNIVRLEIANFLSLMKDAETGQRGFIITGSEVYLEPYQAALKEIDKSFLTLRTLTADNPNQQRRLDATRPLLRVKLTELQETIDLRRLEGLNAATKVIQKDEGRRAMDQIRALATEVDTEERTLRDQRHAVADASATFTRNVVLWGSILGLVMIAVIGWYITRSLSQQIGDAVGHVQSSSSELKAAANQQATGMREQASAMSEITTTVSELLATSRQIAESAQRVALIAEQTTASARSGALTVGNGNESMSGIRSQVDLIVSHMLDLGKKSQQMGAVVEIVAELAEQTNILAINATIEAAGAGESGKRFAVVADEIRKLADRVAVSTKEIRGLIEEVRSSANTTVMTTEAGSKAVDAGSSQFKEVAQAFKQIADLVATTTEAAKEIELSTRQQTTAVEQVNLAITSVAQATKESEVSSGQMLQTSSQLTGLSHDLLQLVQPQAKA